MTSYPMGVLTQSYAWVPNDGPLEISFANGRSVGSLYLSKVDIEMMFSGVPIQGNGNPFYDFVPISSNPQTIPMPVPTFSVTLSGASSGTYYVFAHSSIYQLDMTGPAS